MTISAKYVLHGIVNGANFVSLIENSRVSPECEVLLSTPAGLPYPMNATIPSVKPLVTFETEQLATLLGLGGTNGVHLIDLSAGNTDIYFKKTKNLSTREPDASPVHQRYRAAMACLSVDRITAGDKRPARAFCTLYAIYNGAAVPLVYTGSVALAGTPASADRWFQGPVKITDTIPTTVTIAGVQESTIDFQRRVVIGTGDGEQYATHAYEQETSPILSAAGFDMILPTIGSGVELTDGKWYLRRYKKTGPYADGDAQHILIDLGSALATVEEATGGGNQDAMTRLRVTALTSNPAADPLTITTGSMIT
jgi:hypothetical protein